MTTEEERNLRIRIRGLRKRIKTILDDDSENNEVSLILGDLDAIDEVRGSDIEDELNDIEIRIDAAEQKLDAEFERKKEELKKKTNDTARSPVRPAPGPKLATNANIDALSKEKKEEKEKEKEKKKEEEGEETTDVIAELDRLIQRVTLTETSRTVRQIEDIRLEVYLKEQKAADDRAEEERQRKLENEDIRRKQNVNYDRDRMLATSKV